MPIPPFQPIKRRRLRSPVNLSSEQSPDENSLRVVVKKLQKDVGKQTEILTAILEVLQAQNAKL